MVKHIPMKVEHGDNSPIVSYVTLLLTPSQILYLYLWPRNQEPNQKQQSRSQIEKTLPIYAVENKTKNLN